ncbi:MAG: ribosome rescue GTPase HflX [Gammaproteobacteria bacterium]
MYETKSNLPQHERVILVHLDLPDISSQEDLTEFQQLVHSAGALDVMIIRGTRNKPGVKYFVGQGKAEEIRAAVAETEVELVLFNHELTPSQERNLERLTKCRVLDRTGLILDIFAQRAQTFEGKLQVELAQLQHLSTRLIRGWTHLERQKGGIGLRGPGETQLETDRRLLRNRIKTINRRLQKISKQRQLSRHARQRATLSTISMVGYTNAGKSLLFNRMTQAECYTADKLFATLNPTLRRLEFTRGGIAIMADTVGFIRHLPHDLIAAFRATLEETRDANLLLHVIDIADPKWRDHCEQVNHILKEIGAADIPQIQVYNKIDLLPDCPPHVKYNAEGKPIQVWLSAKESLGLNLLDTAIWAHLFEEPIYRNILLNPDQGKLRAELYRLKAVVSERIDEEGNWLISISIGEKDFERLFSELLKNVVDE